jgi:hypothetical protein
LARRIYNSGWGYKLEYREGGVYKTFKVPLLLFADDLILIGQTLEEMQEMLNICTEEVEELSLEFNEKKSAVVTFADWGFSEEKELWVQGKKLPRGGSTSIWELHYVKIGEII